MKKPAIIFVLFVLAVLAIVLWWRSNRPEPGAAEEKRDPNMVEVAVEAQRNAGIVLTTATEQRIDQFVRTTGVISPDESRVAHIVPLAHGVVEDVFVQLGDRIEKGQPLALFDNIELGESLGEYQNLLGSVSKAVAQEQVAKRSLDRANALIEVQAISPRELELRKAEFEQAQAEVESRRAEAARAEEKLHRFGMTDPELVKVSNSMHGSHRTASHATIRAPLSGVITRYEISKGEVIGPDKELFTIVDTTTIWALADVYEKDIRFVSRGGECGVAVASYPTEVFKGRITYLSDALDPASRTAKLRCVLPNTDSRLKLEMFANVSVPTKESRTGVTVPAGALQEINGQTAVFVQLQPDKFERRVVQIGERNEQQAEILSGVRVGEKVVGDGSFYLKSALMRESIGGEE